MEGVCVWPVPWSRVSEAMMMTMMMGMMMNSSRVKQGKCWCFCSFLNEVSPANEILVPVGDKIIFEQDS